MRSADDFPDHPGTKRSDMRDDELLVSPVGRSEEEACANCFMPRAVIMLMMLVSWLKSK